MTHEVKLPRVSVLTPSYNQARWLPDNLRSVAAQTHPNVEHIVMDGGSTDGSVQILANAQPAVVWESRPDQGQSDAINRAFARSTGEIIGWVNSDDAYFSRDSIAAAVRIFQTSPDIGVVYGHAVLVNSAGTLLHVLWTPPFSKKRLYSWYNPVAQPTVFVRRSVIDRAFFVDRSFDYMMDRELWLHLASRTRFHRINRILAVDRHHPTRKSYTLLDVAARDNAVLAQRYGVPGVEAGRLRLKLVKIGVRIAGATKIGEAAQRGDAFAIEPVSPLALAVRQLAQLRRQMPIDADG